MRPAQGLISQVKRLELYPNGHGKSQGVDQSFRFYSCTFAGHSGYKIGGYLRGSPDLCRTVAPTKRDLEAQRLLGERTLRMVCGA